MMVIEIQISQGSITGAGLTNNRTYLIPAEQCRFNTVNDISDNGGYRLTFVEWIPHAGSTVAVDLDVGANAGTTNRARLAYIGKSGRSVGISDWSFA